MANWAAYQEQITGMPVIKRTSHSLHFKYNKKLVCGYFTMLPCHYLDNGEWKHVDTKLIAKGDGYYGAPYSNILIHPDGRIKLKGTNYQQKSALISPQNGILDGDRMVRRFALGTQYLYMTEEGFRQETIINKMPTKAELKNLIADTSGILPKNYRQHNIIIYDAKKNVHNYSNISVFHTWLENAEFPITIDPDFTAVTGASYYSVYGINTVYATARSTSTSMTAIPYCGQNLSGINYQVLRTLYKFDTSAIDLENLVVQVNKRMVVTEDSTAGGDFDVQIVRQNWLAQDPIGDENREAAYDGCLAETEDNSIWRNTSGMAINTQYTSGDLSTAQINRTGNTYYSYRSKKDRDATVPSGGEYVIFGSPSDSTEAYRPTLIVLYTPYNSQRYMRLLKTFYTG